MADSINISNGGHEDKKNVIILRDSVIEHVNGYDIAGKMDKCKVFVKKFFRSQGPMSKRPYETIPKRKSGSFCLTHRNK